MTDKLKCPFCGEELAPHIDEWKSIRKLFICNNTGCFCWGQPMLLEIWQVLIDGKKAQEALKGIEIRVAAIRSCVQSGYTQLGERNRNIFIALELFKDLIKEITSITKQENE